MSAHDDDGSFDDDHSSTVIDPQVPTGLKDRPQQFDPRARIKDNRWTPPPDNAGPFVPPVIPMAVDKEAPAPVKPRQAAGFDPYARIDDSSRTIKAHPRVQAPQHVPDSPVIPQQVEPRAAAGPVRVISMKTHGDMAAKPERQLPQVKLRAISDVHQTPARGMGNLAPPRDPRESQSRRRRDNMIWASLAVIVASFVMIVVWFLARR